MNVVAQGDQPGVDSRMLLPVTLSPVSGRLTCRYAFREIEANQRRNRFASRIGDLGEPILTFKVGRARLTPTAPTTPPQVRCPGNGSGS